MNMASKKEYEFLKNQLNCANKRENKLQKEVFRLSKELQKEMNKKEDVYKQFIGEMKTLMLPALKSVNEIIDIKPTKRSKLQRLELKAKEGSNKAQFRLGSIYSNGLSNIKVDKKEALKWFKKSANNGNDKAQYNLGVFYESGESVKKDYEESIFWFEKAANQNNAKAQYNLAVMYANGAGVQKDLKLTKYWTLKAIKNDFEKAQKLWDILNLQKIKD